MNWKLYTGIGLLLVAIVSIITLQTKGVEPSTGDKSKDAEVVVANTTSSEIEKKNSIESEAVALVNNKIDIVSGKNQPTKNDVEKSVNNNISSNPITNNSVANPPDQDVISVTINGEKLNAEEIQSLKNIYGSVNPGDYWYDSMIGLYGVMGYGPLGILATGYNFGPMPRNASNGNTGVIINGREITYSEVALLTRYVGQVIPGSYWLDASGNFGFAGSNVTLGNLYSYGGGSTGSSGGDNFWSSSYSAGNYNADNTQGYVSVPGIGPVSYGM
jgi:hypothetical protein